MGLSSFCRRMDGRIWHWPLNSLEVTAAEDVMASVISSWLPRKRPTSDPSWEWGGGGGGLEPCLPKFGLRGNWFVRLGSGTTKVHTWRNYREFRELGRITRFAPVIWWRPPLRARHEIGFFDLGLGSPCPGCLGVSGGAISAGGRHDCPGGESESALFPELQ